MTIQVGQILHTASILTLLTLKLVAPAPTPTPSETTATNTERATTGVPQTNLNTGGRSQTGSATATGSLAKGNGTRTSGGRHTMFNPQDPAGSVVMLTPAITDGSQLYKMKDFVTWGWNYTNLQATPTAVDLKISAVKQTWTLTQNMTFATKGSYTWDTAAFQSANIANPLPVEQYTLIIHDSDGSATQTAEAGYLAPFSGFIFGLYTPKPVVDSDQFVCVTCNGGLSVMERRAVGGAVVMSILTVFSFTWFVAGFGAFV